MLQQGIGCDSGGERDGGRWGLKAKAWRSQVALAVGCNSSSLRTSPGGHGRLERVDFKLEGLEFQNLKRL